MIIKLSLGILFSDVECFVPVLEFTPFFFLTLNFLIYAIFFAVWRHVLGSNDAIDGIDIALGKCMMLQ